MRIVTSLLFTTLSVVSCGAPVPGPRGPDGAAGPEGADGAPGATGPTGSPGAPGVSVADVHEFHLGSANPMIGDVGVGSYVFDAQIVRFDDGNAFVSLGGIFVDDDISGASTNISFSEAFYLYGRTTEQERTFILGGLFPPNIVRALRVRVTTSGATPTLKATAGEYDATAHTYTFSGSDVSIALQLVAP